jgi:DNA-binding NarL/FixJ family response regulator
MSKSDKKVILLIEDDTLVEVFVKGMVNNFGYEVITANSGEMALALVLNHEKIDLILLDIDLGQGIDGPTTAWQILKKKSIPIIFLLDSCKNEYANKLREIPCYGILLKASGEFVLHSSIEIALNLFENKKNLKKEIAVPYQKEELSMEVPIKILHINADFKITYFIKKSGSIIRSSISLEKAVKLLKEEEFDLILSEPHNKAILKPQADSLSMDNKIRVLIVDDNPILREGLKSVLSQSSGFDIVGEAANGLEAVDSVEKYHPDLVLMDLSMPEMDGIAATKEIKKQWPETKILIFTIYNSSEYLTATSNAGADGYVTKDSSQVEFVQSIRDILAGKKGVHLGVNPPGHLSDVAPAGRFHRP